MYFIIYSFIIFNNAFKIQAYFFLNGVFIFTAVYYANKLLG